MNFISIDQSASASGFCIWEDNQPKEWGVISPIPKTLREGARLNSIRR